MPLIARCLYHLGNCKVRWYCTGHYDSLYGLRHPDYILSTPPGILSAVPCPRGTLRNQTGAAVEGDCFPCPPGYYCAQEGAIEVSGECDSRYYCPDFANVTSAQPSGFECPAGFFCVQKTATPQACLPGKTLVGVWTQQLLVKETYWFPLVI